MREQKEKSINWKVKLSSRKFWVGIAGWVTSLLTAFNITESTIARVVLIISGIGSLVVYMFTEAMTDKAHGTLEGIEVQTTATIEETE